MILPIYLYGSAVLRDPAESIDSNSDELQTLIDDMLETMRNAAGIGLAAPQIGKGIRMFVVDLGPLSDDLAEDGEEVPPQPMVFINPEITEETEEEGGFEEGCLSIPDIREDVRRPIGITIQYIDRQFTKQTLEAEGMLARVIQHEYDHLEGVLFLDYVSSFKRKLLKRRLRDISTAMVEVEYEVTTEAEVPPA